MVSEGVGDWLELMGEDRHRTATLSGVSSMGLVELCILKSCA